MLNSVETKSTRVVVARMQPGDDVIKTIEAVALEHKISVGQLSLIGAVSHANLGFFDLESKEYLSYAIDKNLEVVSCMGNISISGDGALVVHAHMVVSDREGRCYAGHLLPGCEVSVTIELIITELDYELTRSRDDSTGLNLLDIG